MSMPFSLKTIKAVPYKQLYKRLAQCINNGLCQLKRSPRLLNHKLDIYIDLKSTICKL